MPVGVEVGALMALTRNIISKAQLTVLARRGVETSPAAARIGDCGFRLRSVSSSAGVTSSASYIGNPLLSALNSFSVSTSYNLFMSPHLVVSMIAIIIPRFKI